MQKEWEIPTLCHCIGNVMAINKHEWAESTLLEARKEDVMKKRRVVDVVADIVSPFCKANEMELVDVEFVKEGPFRYLRIIIDKEEGVSLDDCSMVSKFLNSKLDEIDPIEEQYFLEVTSPGVERELKKDEDFGRFAGRLVQANLFQPLNGKKVIKGTLKGLKENRVIIETENHGELDIPKDKVALIKLVVEFDDKEEE